MFVLIKTLKLKFLTCKKKHVIFLVNVDKGNAHFFSRIRQLFKVKTDLVIAGVKSTEFLVKAVPNDNTLVSVFEGHIEATSTQAAFPKTIDLKNGDAAIFAKGQKPIKVKIDHPRDDVQWALYYPPVIDFRKSDFQDKSPTDWQMMVRRSIDFYWQGDLANAFKSLEKAPADKIKDRRFFTYRATLFLTVGRVEEAEKDIDRALALVPEEPSQTIKRKSKRQIDLSVTFFGEK